MHSVVFSPEMAAVACTNHMYCGLGEVNKGKGEWKQRNTEHTVVPNVALFKVGFQ
jgi:hypothetical protein